jgi:beta-glucosidase
MGEQAVVGMQGEKKRDLAKSTKVAASLKHFIGYSDPRTGQDRTQAWIPNRY